MLHKNTTRDYNTPTRGANANQKHSPGLQNPQSSAPAKTSCNRKQKKLKNKDKNHNAHKNDDLMLRMAILELSLWTPRNHNLAMIMFLPTTP